MTRQEINNESTRTMIKKPQIQSNGYKRHCFFLKKQFKGKISEVKWVTREEKPKLAKKFRHTKNWWRRHLRDSKECEKRINGFTPLEFPDTPKTTIHEVVLYNCLI